ncbi:hypothetical protein ACWED2_14440 [Amycolatopsis sp. NPDC005003]
MPELPLDRRGFLAVALAAGAAALPGGFPAGAAAAPRSTLPERGIHDTAPATSWTDGFLTGTSSTPRPHPD